KAVAEALGRVEPIKATFNVAQWSLAAAVGAAVFGALGPGTVRDVGDLPALAVATAGVALVNDAAIVAVLSLVGRRPVGEVLARLRPAVVSGWVIGQSVNLAFGMVFAATFVWAPVVSLLFFVPLVVLHRASRAYAVS